MSGISIIVPIHNTEQYLKRCLDSILKQSFQDFSLILVDDGSTDDCGKICDEYASRDQRISVIHQENKGVSGARNSGLDFAFKSQNPKWIAFVDSDDCIHLNFFETLFKVAEKYSVNISACSYQQLKEPLCEEPIHKYDVQIYNGEEFGCEQNKHAQSVWGMLINGELIRNIRFPEGKYFDDVFVVYKLFLPQEKIAFVNYPMYYYNLDNLDSITRSKWTPKRLDVIDGIAEKLKYAQKFHYKNYYRIELKTYIESIIEARYCAKRAGYNKVVPDIEKRLRKALITGNKTKVFPIEEHYDTYELMFPRRMILYYYFKAAKNMLKRVKSADN